MVFYGKDYQHYGMNPNRENIMEIWKDYTIENAIFVIENAMKVIKLKTINSCWRKLSRYDFRGFTTDPVKEIRKEIIDMAGKKGKKGWKI